MKRVFISLVLCLVLLELGARVISKLEFADTISNKESLYVPHPYLGYSPRPGAYREDYRDGYLRINSRGFRGNEFEKEKSESTTRIVCLGGSTTYSSKVGNETTYPVLLEKELNLESSSFEVINAGVGSYTSAESLINFELRVQDLKPDWLLIYHGVNDVHPRVTPGFRNDYGHYRRTFQPPETSLLGRLASYSGFAGILGHTLYRNYGIHKLTTKLDFDLVTPSEQEQNFSQTEPAVFERNIRSIIELAHARGIEVVLVTFFYQPDFLKVSDRFSYQAYSRGIFENNQVLRQLAEETPAHLIDLAEVFPNARKELYKDVVHLNSEGTQVKAQLIGERLEDIVSRTL